MREYLRMAGWPRERVSVVVPVAVIEIGEDDRARSGSVHRIDDGSAVIRREVSAVPERDETGVRVV